MANTVNINKIKSGQCPHGCSPSACPICSGMGGGSVKSTGIRPGERVQKPGEMSYYECVMQGLMIKARKDALNAHNQNLQKQVFSQKEFELTLAKASVRLVQFADRISKNFLFKPVAYTINSIVVPIINLVKNVPAIIKNLAEKLSQLKIDIQDKLNAIFGEKKLFIEKKVSELINLFKSKFEILFKIFKKHDTNDEDTKIDEDKKIFNLKTLINKILKKKKDDTEN